MDWIKMSEDVRMRNHFKIVQPEDTWTLLQRNVDVGFFTQNHQIWFRYRFFYFLWHIFHYLVFRYHFVLKRNSYVLTKMLTHPVACQPVLVSLLVVFLRMSPKNWKIFFLLYLQLMISTKRSLQFLIWMDLMVINSCLLIKSFQITDHAHFSDIKWKNTLRFVRLYFDTPTFDRITKDRAAKFTDMLSAIGGTMGLLTGFSIISGIEIIYFTGKAIFNLLRNKKK